MSLSNLIHRLEYTERDDSIRIRQYTRRLTYSTTPINYECVVWPILASGFQKVEAVFKFPVSLEHVSSMPPFPIGPDLSLLPTVRYLGSLQLEQGPSQKSHPVSRPSLNRSVLFFLSQCDNLVTGDREQLDDSLTYWRARFIVIPSERDPDTNLKPGTNEKFTVEEVS